MAKKSKVDISKQVTLAVSGLGKPKRENSAFTASWTYNDNCFSEKRADRFQGVLIKWNDDTSGSASSVKTTKKTLKSKTKTGKGKKKNVTKTKVTIESVTGLDKRFTLKRASGKKATSSKYTLTRANYYPYTKKTTSYVAYPVTKVARSGNNYLVYVNASKKAKISKASYDAYLATGVGVKMGSYNNAKKAYNLAASGYNAAKTARNKSKSKQYKKVNAVAYVVQAQTTETPLSKLYGVAVEVQGWNVKSPRKGKAKKTTQSNVKWNKKAPTQAAYFPIGAPAQPTGTFSVGKAVEDDPGVNHVMQIAVKSPNDKSGGKERLRCLNTCTCERSMNTNGSTFKLETVNVAVKDARGTSGCASTKLENYTISVDPNDYMTGYVTYQEYDSSLRRNVTRKVPRQVLGLVPGEYMIFRFKIIAQGYAGDSSALTYSQTFAWPHTPTIRKIEDMGQHNRITFTVSGDNSKSHTKRYTTTYTLQRLANFKPSGYRVEDWSDAQWIQAANRSTSWTDVYVAEEEARQFSDTKRDSTPEPFNRTYYRIKAENEIVGMPALYSSPMVMPGFLRIPSARNEKVEFLAGGSSSDGKAIRLVIAFDCTETTPGYPDSVGTEISWDQDSYAWNSNTGPSKFDAKDEDGYKSTLTNALKTKNNWVSSHNYYTTVYIRGVEQATPYYVRARRFLKDVPYRETASYGPYADYSVGGGKATLVAASRPSKVTLSGPATVPRGQDFSLMWTYEGDGTQTEYELMYTTNSNENSKTGAKSFKSEKTAYGYTVIKYDELIKKISGNMAYFCVKMKEDSAFSDLSNIVSVKIVEPPTASLQAPSMVTSKPFSATLYTTDSSAQAVVRVIASQVSTWTPTGKYIQPEDDIVYSEKFTPTWRQYNDSNTYYANLTFPQDMELYDGGHYTIEYYVVNDDTKLDSRHADEDGDFVGETKEFTVKWDHQAQAPDFLSVALRIPGKASAEIRPVKPANWKEGDVCDIYRVTPDGAYLIAYGVAFGKRVTDRYAPYSKYAMTRYRICTRTSDGDMDWIDIGYTIPGYSVRFDWGYEDAESNSGYNSLELPYNLKFSDSYTKNSRIQLHLDGLYRGYWRGGIDRKNTLSTEVVKYDDPQTVERIRALARYSGPVFVRLPDGCAFEANVEVTDLSNSYDSETITASFSAQEIALGGQFVVQANDIV